MDELKQDLRLFQLNFQNESMHPHTQTPTEWCANMCLTTQQLSEKIIQMPRFVALLIFMV